MITWIYKKRFVTLPQSLKYGRETTEMAFSMSLIDNGEAWLEMIDDRNKTSHLYDEEMATEVMDAIIHTYCPLFVELQNKMNEIANK